MLDVGRKADGSFRVSVQPSNISQNGPKSGESQAQNMVIGMLDEMSNIPRNRPTIDVPCLPVAVPHECKMCVGLNYLPAHLQSYRYQPGYMHPALIINGPVGQELICGTCGNPMAPSFGWIYFVRAESGHYKIGYAKADVVKRVTMLQTGHPHPLHVSALIYSSADLERKLHNRFDTHRYRGEWFHPHQSLTEYIDRRCICIGMSVRDFDRVLKGKSHA